MTFCLYISDSYQVFETKLSDRYGGYLWWVSASTDVLPRFAKTCAIQKPRSVGFPWINPQAPVGDPDLCSPLGQRGSTTVKNQLQIALEPSARQDNQRTRSKQIDPEGKTGTQSIKQTDRNRPRVRTENNQHSR